MTTSLHDDDELIQILRDSADSIYAFFEDLGPDSAKKARDLRAINARLIRAASQSPAMGGYYRKFEDALDALLVYLYQFGSPLDKEIAMRNIESGGFVARSKSGTYKALWEAIYYQTKSGNNGRKNLRDNGKGIISLTSAGKIEAEKLVARYGHPPPSNS
jgi:hypothetical protein